MKTHLILLNGAPSTGKSTLAKMVARLGDEDDAVGYMPTMSFAQPLRDMLFDFARSHLWWNGPRNAQSLSDLKAHEFFPEISGRDLMIGWGSGMRGLDADIFPKILMKFVTDTQTQKSRIIVDDLGFANEDDWLSAQTDVQTHVIYLEQKPWLWDEETGVEPQEFRTYSQGEIFDGDSRICLRDRAVLTDPSPEELLAYIKALPIL